MLDIFSKSWKSCSFTHSCLIGQSLINHFFIYKLKLNHNNLQILWFMYCSSMCILLLMYTCPISMSLVIWIRTVYPNSPGVPWPSPQTAYNLLLPDGVVLKNQKRHLSDSFAPSSAWSRYAEPGAPFKGLLGVGGREKERGDPKHFSPLARVSLDPMERGLPTLNKLLWSVLR